MGILYNTRSILLVTTTVVLLTLVITAFRITDYTARARTSTIVLTKDVLDGSLPALDTSQRVRIMSILSSDKGITSLLAGHSFTQVGTTAWTRSEGTIIGAAVRLELIHQATLAGNWSVLQYNCNDGGVQPYTVSIYSAKQSNVSYLDLLIDLGLERVVATQADPRSAIAGGITWIKRARHLYCQPIG